MYMYLQNNCHPKVYIIIDRPAKTTGMTDTEETVGREPTSVGEVEDITHSGA